MCLQLGSVVFDRAVDFAARENVAEKDLFTGFDIKLQVFLCLVSL